MSYVSHVECPVCGAAIGVSDLSRLVRCAHCDNKLLVEGHVFVNEYQVPPSIDRTAARRKVQRALSGKQMPAELLRRSRLDTARLVFVPYNRVFARRVGKVVTMDSQKRSPLTGEKKDEVFANTRVVVTDVDRTLPAVALPDWGLEHSALMQSKKEMPFDLISSTRDALARKGRLYHPTIPPMRVLEQLESGNKASNMVADTTYLEQRFSRVFYPVWRIRYRYNRRFYWATVDGATGELLTLRAPESDRARLKWLLGTAIFTALILGKGAKVLVSAYEELGSGAIVAIATHPVSWIVLVFTLGFLVLLLSVGWEQFRYAGELVFSGSHLNVIKLNKPPGETRIVRFVVGFLDRLGDVVKPKERHL